MNLCKKDLTTGATIEINNEPYLILENTFVSPGRSQAFNKLKLKNLITDVILTKTIKVNERLKEANIYNKTLMYMYKNDNCCYFYNQENLEYHEINLKKIESIEKWLKEGINYTVTFWNNEVINIKLPKFINLKVIESENFNKNFCISKNSKYAKLETGIEIKVPTFIRDNDIIKVDTEKEIYVSRVNE